MERERPHYTKNADTRTPGGAFEPGRPSDAERLDSDAAELKVGELKRLVADRGFGFIAVEGEVQEYFIHFSAWGDPLVPFDQLRPGALIEFVGRGSFKGQRALAARFATEQD